MVHILTGYVAEGDVERKRLRFRRKRKTMEWKKVGSVMGVEEKRICKSFWIKSRWITRTRRS